MRDNNGENKKMPISKIVISCNEDGYGYSVFSEKDGRIEKKSYHSDSPDEILKYVKDDLMTPHMKNDGYEEEKPSYKRSKGAFSK